VRSAVVNVHHDSVFFNRSSSNIAMLGLSDLHHWKTLVLCPEGHIAVAGNVKACDLSTALGPKK